MKVKVTIEVIVDREDYDAEYAEHATAEDIRAHVKGAIGSAAQSAFENIDSVTVTDWN